MLQVRTGCRLHFGLMELAQGASLRFAGMGLMLSQPSVVLSFSEREPHGPSYLEAELEQRIQAVKSLRASLYPHTGACYVHVEQSLPLHSGLGAGTQIASAVATGLEFVSRSRGEEPSHFPDNPPATAAGAASNWQAVSQFDPRLTPEWLAQHAARGLRSAVGLCGFLSGGLILDRGYTSGRWDVAAQRPIAIAAAPLPASWRVVLMLPQLSQRVFGREEAELIARLGQSSNSHKDRMLELALQLQSLARDEQNFEPFTSHLDEYMELGARLFSRHQGGMYNGQQISQTVAAARAAGLRGVGQSSWGPTVFGFAKNVSEAERSLGILHAELPDTSVVLTSPAAHGAEYRWLNSQAATS